jgi:hypothetical protein
MCAIMTPGQQFFVPRNKQGEIPDYFWVAVAQGYEAEIASAEPKEVVFDPEA